MPPDSVAAPPLTYAAAGVAPAGGLLAGLLSWVNRTSEHRSGSGRALIPNGYFASVVHLRDDLALALCTDGVGTKILVAEMLGRFDTIGIDCVAMNVNDLICTGAEPVALVDYIATARASAGVLEAVGRGLFEGARQAGITIPGGELAQLPEMIRGVSEATALDLVGTAVGVVHPARIIDGGAARPGDVVLGLASGGIHSNGLSLARRVLFQTAGLRPDEHVPELGRSAGEELLEPTRIYVRGVMALLREQIPVHAAAHITGDGLLNLARGAAPVGFVLDRLPDPPAIFGMIQRLGDICDAEMYHTFNMGVGFCIVVPAGAVDVALKRLGAEGYAAAPIGRVVAGDDRKILLEERRLVGSGGEFVPA